MEPVPIRIPAGEDQDTVVGLMGERLSRALAGLLGSLLVVLPLVLAAMSTGISTRLEIATVAGLLVFVAALKLLQRRGHLRLVVGGLVAALVICGAVIGMSFGSVRSVGMMALVSAIVVGGIFLGRRALFATVAASAVVIAALIHAQRSGWLHPPELSVAWMHGVIYVAVLSAIALNIWFARSLVIGALQRVRENEAWLGSVLRNTPGALITASSDEGRILDVNAAFERIFGLSRERTVGRTARELGIWDDLSVREDYVERMRTVGRIENLAVRLRRANGEGFDALLSGETIDFGGELRLVSAVTDISAESAALRKHAASETRFRKLFEASPAATAIFTPQEGRIVDCNAAYVELLGRRREAIIDHTGRELGIWRDFEQREHAWRAFLREGAIRNRPAELVRGDGELRNCLINWSNLEIGGTNYVLAHVTDVTEQLRAESALRASESRFEALFQNNPAALVVQDRRSMQLVLINHAAEQMFRAGASATLGTQPGDRFWADHAEAQAFWARVERDGRAGSTPVRLRRADGEVFDALISVELTEQDGARQSLIAMVDVSQELRLRVAQQASEELILEAARGVSAETGEAFFRLLVEHLARATGGDRANVGELIDGGTRVRTIARFVGGEPAAAVEYEIAGTPCGAVLQRREILIWDQGVAEHFPADEPLIKAGLQGYIGAPLIGVDGQPAGIMNVMSSRPLARSPRLEAVFRIFAARAQAELARLQREREIRALNASLEQRVRERTAQLEAANRELEAFSYSASHDLRAPLRAIDGFARLLEERHAGALGEEALGHLHRVRAGTQQMGRIIDDMLALARVSRTELRPVRVDLSRLARAVAAELSRGQPQRRVQWRIADGLAARADLGLTHIVLVNLLGNAWKYTGQREQAVIEFDSPGRTGELIELRVADNGAGFDMRHAAALFQPFRRLHAQHEFEGTGIGLATVQRIVERHGGTVRGEGRVDAGATFTVSLPVADEPASATG